MEGKSFEMPRLQLEVNEELEKRELAIILKKTRAALEELNHKYEERRAFLSRMSHDIRTPLNGIIGIIEIDDRHPDDTELLQRNRAKARVAASHLLDLVNDVLELTRMEDKDVKLSEEAFDIRELVGDISTISDLRASEKGITLHHADMSAFDRHPYVFGSPLHVKQLLLNIIGNAIKYNQPEGSVTCTIFLDGEDEDRVRYGFTIADTGMGMSPEFLDHIYEPFSRERDEEEKPEGGSGLGMAIVKSYVDKMQGTIDVESSPGLGSVFRVAIPFRKARAGDLPSGEEDEAIDLTGTRALLVEDNDLNMEIAEAILQEAGVSVTRAGNGKEAVDLYRSGPPGSFDLILMDLVMPVMDGFTATEMIRAMDPPYGDIPIIAMTANAFADDVQKCLEEGMNGHLSKPLEPDRIRSVIAQQTGRK